MVSTKLAAVPFSVCSPAVSKLYFFPCWLRAVTSRLSKVIVGSPNLRVQRYPCCNHTHPVLRQFGGILETGLLNTDLPLPLVQTMDNSTLALLVHKDNMIYALWKPNNVKFCIAILLVLRIYAILGPSSLITSEVVPCSSIHTSCVAYTTATLWYFHPTT